MLFCSVQGCYCPMFSKNLNPNKMKKIIIITLLICAIYSSYAQNSNTDKVVIKKVGPSIESVFEHLSFTDITSGYLLDKQPYWIMPDDTDNLFTTEVNKSKMMQQFLTLSKCKVSGNYSIPNWDTVHNRAIAFNKLTKQIPIVVINMAAQKIKLNAIDSNWLQIIDSSYYVDVANRSQSPYETKEIFASSPWIEKLSGDDFIFYVGDQFYFSNDADMPDSITIDFGNGEGTKNYAWNTSIAVHYPATTSRRRCSPIPYRR
jgi:hypothetical protein